MTTLKKLWRRIVNDAAIQPEADEVCDEIDNDCDGLVDDQDDDLLTETGAVFYADSDGDGFGDPDQIQMACIQPSVFSPTRQTAMTVMRRCILMPLNCVKPLESMMTVMD